ncbi:BZ3500_MvSof-1268-A1-R1_Chr3-1g06143 [Microbotryum saponariae]|uniref:BZ3500_MvSof-1268-A1-R1_Chr3-1g06143 protein n=1 Tax=Microbotryum saponariae TaxID=289078 RepID=A0A2X0KZE9_9BASI|nr:BZ3500_MvSof-1268-A1-R1_Chr3-1g06143 [Microbotryum saponariae]SDA04006.1 BZ3501_MvSof-1269-A2-R1_Chr3-2g05828 [Microbotryum saponariae]
MSQPSTSDDLEGGRFTSLTTDFDEPAAAIDADSQLKVGEGTSTRPSVRRGASAAAAAVVVARPSTSSPLTSDSSLSGPEETSPAASATPVMRYPLRTISTQPNAPTASSTNVRRKWNDEHHLVLTRLVKGYQNAGQEVDWEEVGRQIGRSATATISKWKRLVQTKSVPKENAKLRGAASKFAPAVSEPSSPSTASSGATGSRQKATGKTEKERQTSLKETRRTIKLITSDQNTSAKTTTSKRIKKREEVQDQGGEGEEREQKSIAIKTETPVLSAEKGEEHKPVHAPFEAESANFFKGPFVPASSPPSSSHTSPTFRPWTPSEDFSLVYSVILRGEHSWDVVMNERAPETQHHPPYASDQARLLPSLRECGRSVDEVVARWFESWRARVAEHGNRPYTSSSSFFKSCAEPHPDAQLLPDAAPLMSREPSTEPSLAPRRSFQSYVFYNAPPLPQAPVVLYHTAQAQLPARDEAVYPSQRPIDMYQQMPLSSASYYPISHSPLSLPPQSSPVPCLDATTPNFRPNPYPSPHGARNFPGRSHDSQVRRSSAPEHAHYATSPSGGPYRALFDLHDHRYSHQPLQPELRRPRSNTSPTGALATFSKEVSAPMAVEGGNLAGAEYVVGGEGVHLFPLRARDEEMHRES